MTNTQQYIGKTVIIGLTHLDADEKLIKYVQLYGVIERIDLKQGIFVKLDDGSNYSLPPQTDALKMASPGEYKLKSTGKIILDPDYLTTWTIKAPRKH